MRWEMPAGGSLELYEHFVEADEAPALFARLCEQVAFAQHIIRILGREIPQPRLSAWVGDPHAVYTYSGLLNERLHWPPVLAELRARVVERAEAPFDSVLCNLYRDGNDSMGFHADAEPELGPAPVIASLSLGAVRRFQLRHKRDASDRLDLDLPSGSLLVMRGALQQHYKHAVPKQRSIREPRINLTFRRIVR